MAGQVVSRSEPESFHPPDRSAVKGTLLVFAAALLWGSNGLVSSQASPGTSALALGAAGMAIGGLLLFATTRGTTRFVSSCSRRDRLHLAVGAVAVAGFPVFFYPAVARAGVAVPTALAMGSAPLFAGLLSCFIHRSRPTNRWCVATLAAVIGCVTLVLGRPTAGGSSQDDLGMLLAVLAGLFFATYSFIGSQFISRGHASAQVMAAMFGGGGVVALTVLLFAGVDNLADARGLSIALYLAGFATFLAYRLYGSGLRHTGPHVATSLALAEPAVAAMLGVCVLDERLPLLSWLGLAVLGVGLLWLVYPDRSQRIP